MAAPSSADAGPSNSGGGSSHAHPAFPTAQQLQSQRGEPQMPSSVASLWKQITDARTPDSLGDVAHVLKLLTVPPKGAEHNRRDLLLLDGVDLTKLSDAQLPPLTLGLVYVL